MINLIHIPVTPHHEFFFKVTSVRIFFWRCFWQIQIRNNSFCSRHFFFYLNRWASFLKNFEISKVKWKMQRTSWSAQSFLSLFEKVNRVNVLNNSIINREKSLIHYLKSFNDRNFFSRLTSLDLGIWFNRTSTSNKINNLLSHTIISNRKWTKSSFFESITEIKRTQKCLKNFMGVTTCNSIYVGNVASSRLYS